MNPTITVDGETVTMPAGNHAVSDVVRAAGLKPGAYDLLRVRSNGHTATYYDGDTVTTAPGDEFISARISTGTA